MNTRIRCFAYKDFVGTIGEEGQLIGVIAVGYADEMPNPRPRKGYRKDFGFS